MSGKIIISLLILSLMILSGCNEPEEEECLEYKEKQSITALETKSCSVQKLDDMEAVYSLINLENYTLSENIEKGEYIFVESEDELKRVTNSSIFVCGEYNNKEHFPKYRIEFNTEYGCSDGECNEGYVYKEVCNEYNYESYNFICCFYNFCYDYGNFAKRINDCCNVCIEDCESENVCLRWG